MPQKLPDDPRFLEWLDKKCPPFLAYANARSPQYNRTNGNWAGLNGIVERSGLSKRTVARVLSRTSWRGVKIEVISLLLSACEIRLVSEKRIHVLDLSNLKRVLRDGLPHLPEKQWKWFDKRCQKWRAEHKTTQPLSQQ